MSNWAGVSMREAIAHLLEHNRRRAADDLSRLLGELNLNELEIMRDARSDRIINEVVRVETLEDLVECLHSLAALVGSGHATVHVVSESKGSSFRTRVVTTYPETWIERYVQRRYMACDPVQATARSSVGGFYWSDIAATDPISLAFWRDADKHGVGSTGYSQPVQTLRGDRLALSVSTTELPTEFRSRFEYFRCDVSYIANYFVDTFSQLASDDRPSRVDPNDLQLMVLRAVATGHDDAVLRGTTFGGLSYAQLERSICAHFGTRTIAQAAVIASQVGLLDDAPLSRPDITSHPRTESARSGIAIDQSAAAVRQFGLSPGEAVRYAEAAEDQKEFVGRRPLDVLDQTDPA